MYTRTFRQKITQSLAVSTLLLVAQVSFGQNQSVLLRFQRSEAALSSDATGGMRGQGGNILTLGSNPATMAVSSYPNATSCVLLYNDGRYILEKRDEHTVGRPKVKKAEGTLSAGDLEELKAILANNELKEIPILKAPQPPSETEALREAETLEVQISREGETQHFVAIKERFKTQALGSTVNSTGASTGLDTFLDNAAAYRKNLKPLEKWFAKLQKKSKSSFKDSQPQYCMPMNIG